MQLEGEAPAEPPTRLTLEGEAPAEPSTIHYHSVHRLAEDGLAGAAPPSSGTPGAGKTAFLNYFNSLFRMFRFSISRNWLLQYKVGFVSPPNNTRTVSRR